MSFLNYETISGYLRDVAAHFDKWGLNIKYGANFNIKAEFEGVTKTQGERSGALFSNHVTALGYVRCTEAFDQPVYDGFNAAMLGEDGLPDYDLVANAISKLYDTERDGGNARAILASSIKEDNSVMLLYNMLRLYAIKKLQETKRCKVAPDDIIYDDGHVQVNAAAFLGINAKYDIADFEIRRVNNLVAAVQLQRGAKFDGGDAYIANIDRMTAKDQTVLAIAAKDWPDQELPFRVCHPSFPAANIMVMHEHEDKIRDVVEYDDLTAADVLTALARFVENMRIQAHFDMAYGIFCQVLYTHLPRSVEAFVWYGKRPELVMSKSKSPRGIHPLMTGGQPFVTDVSRWATFKSYLNYPDRAILHSLALSEAVMTSTFDTLTRAKDQPDPLSGIVSNYYAYETGLLRDLIMAGMRFGYDLSMPWASGIGLKRYNWLDERVPSKLLNVRILDAMAPQTYNIVKKVINGQELNAVHLLELVPACYPILSMGIRASKFYMNELVQEVELHGSSLRNMLYTTDANDAHKAMSIWRVMGWDTTVRRLSDGAFFSNWAPNANGHYLPAFASDGELVQSYEFSAETITKRGYNWIEMPNITNRFKMRIEMQYLMHKIFVDGRDTRAFGSPVVMKPVDPSEGRRAVLGENMRYTAHIVKGIDAVQKMSDFRRLWQSSLEVADVEIFTGHTT